LTRPAGAVSGDRATWRHPIGGISGRLAACAAAQRCPRFFSAGRRSAVRAGVGSPPADR